MNIIKKTSKKHNVSPNNVRQEINMAISTAKSNPSTQEMWQKLFPDGRKPSPEEFILVIANFIRNNKTF